MAVSKYTPLKDYLRGQNLDRVPMHFRDIEGVLGFGLPRSSRDHRAWWSNNPSNSVITHAWLEAGYETSEVDMASERLTFRRVRKMPPASPVARPAATKDAIATAGPRRSPLFGALRGMITLAPETDLTQPADPNWANRYDD